MNMIQPILKYFPDLSAMQRRQFEMMGPLYEEWNAKINVISRKDIQNLMTHHVLHSLAIAKFLTPVSGTSFIDVGTGGGFPGIPLAVMWPDCQFLLVDRIGKKLRVAKEIADAIGLTNVRIHHGDIGECHERFDFAVSRAVMELGKLIPLIRKNVSRDSKNGVPNGLICLKGGDLADEIAKARVQALDVPLTDYFSEEFFATKQLIYCPV